MEIGIDFGTTNSAVAVVHPDGQPRIVELVPGERTQRTVIHHDPDGVVRFGNAAFAAYLEADMQGRFLRSLKAYLPQDVPATTLGRARVTFVELVSRYLEFLVGRTEDVLGGTVTSVVVGRPVRFHADPDKDRHAVDQLQAAIALAGLPLVEMRFEPVAAARRYEWSLQGERIVLVGDFGGGTADFAILKVGPDRVHRADRGDDLLAAEGVAAAGDALDGRFMDAFVVPFLGRGEPFLARRATAPRPWKPNVLKQVGKLYDLHRLRDPALETYLSFAETRVEDPAKVERLRRLIFEDLGYPMAAAIEAAKRGLGADGIPRFRFDAYYIDRLTIETDVASEGFAEASAAILASYRSAIDRALVTAGLDEGGVDEVFLTGGTSQLPFVRQLFADRFGPTKLRDADAFTTVCEGLALA